MMRCLDCIVRNAFLLKYLVDREKVSTFAMDFGLYVSMVYDITKTMYDINCT